MAKIILEFDSIEEADEARCALDSYKWKSVVWDIDQEFRKTSKYEKSVLSESPASEEEQQIAEKYREILREILQQYGLSL